MLAQATIKQMPFWQELCSKAFSQMLKLRPDHALSKQCFHQSATIQIRRTNQSDDNVTILSEELYSNPIEKLQPLVQVPILAKEDVGFSPDQDEVIKGSTFFESGDGEPVEFLGSWPNPHIMPKWGTPEVAFIGRSNVGKSSLLAAMFAHIPDVRVRTSSKPGHTKLMNVFNVKNKFHLVDMPGYGFNMPDHFETSVEAYLRSRRSLTRVFVLIDGQTGPEGDEYTAVEMMEEMGVPYVFVLTKLDLAKPGKLVRNLMSVIKFRDESGAASCFPQPFLVSSRTGEGIPFLQTFVAHITGNLAIKSRSHS